MIAHLHGLLLAATPSYVIIDVNGVGYKVYIAATTLGKLPSLNQPCRLWIAHIIREQSQTLYGFTDSQECELFDKLLIVKGIGPKLSLNILGHTGAKELLRVLAEGDTAMLSRIPGIGKKTAERLIVEMRDRVPSGGYVPGSIAPTAPQSLAVSALLNLGYNEAAARNAVKKGSAEQNDPDLASLISAALQHL